MPRRARGARRPARAGPERRAEAQALAFLAGEPGARVPTASCDRRVVTQGPGRVRRDAARWYLADEVPSLEMQGHVSVGGEIYGGRRLPGFFIIKKIGLPVLP